MTDEKWEQVITMIKTKFDIEDQGVEDLNPGTCEYYIFEGPQGRMKLERIIQPKLVDRKVQGSRRIGGDSKEERIYSQDETVSFIEASMWNEDVQAWSDVNAADLL